MEPNRGAENNESGSKLRQMGREWSSREVQSERQPAGWKSPGHIISVKLTDTHERVRWGRVGAKSGYELYTMLSKDGKKGLRLGADCRYGW